MISPLSTLRSLFLLQLLSRLLTFSLNQFLLRLVSPASFGIANVQFELLGGTILVLAREAVRGVVLRKNAPNEDGKVDERQRRNLYRTPFLLSLIIIPFIIPLYLSTLSSSLTSHPNFDIALSLHILAIFLELSTESSYLQSLQSGQVKTRVKAEGLGVILRAAITVAWLIGVRGLYAEEEVENQALIAFGMGQLGWAGCLVWIYGREKYGIGRWPFYEKVEGSARIDRGSYHPILPPSSPSLITTLSLHSIIKHLLTEGDRLVVSRVSGLEDGAGYAVAGNYASLIARIVFQPVEESTRLFFSNTLGGKEDGLRDRDLDTTNATGMSETTRTVETNGTTGTTSNEADKRFIKNTKASITNPAAPSSRPRQIYILLIRTSLLLLLLCPAFIPPILPYLLPIILPPRYLSTSAPSTLLAYLTIYIPILALNGILEAVFSVTASSGAVVNQGGMMVLCSGVFGLALLGMAKGRDIGWISYTAESCLVAANALQMIIRIIYAWAHTRKVFAEGRVRVGEVLPGWKTVGAVGIAGLGLRVFVGKVGTGGLGEVIKVVVGGGVMGVGCLSIYYVEERRAWQAATRHTLKDE